MVEIVGHSQTKGRDNREPKLQPKPARQSSTLPVGAGGGRLPPATRWASSDRRLYSTLTSGNFGGLLGGRSEEILQIWVAWGKAVAVWGYPDGVFASDYDIVSDTSKAGRFGFHDLVEPRRCFFGCFQTFGVSGSFRDLPNVLAKDWRSGGTSVLPFNERSNLRSMDHIAVSLAPER